MKRRIVPLTLAAIFALSCQSPDVAVAATDTSDLSDLYGNYLAGSYAHKIEDRASQQKYFTDAFLQQPTDTRIGRRAIVSAIETGDFAAAIRLSEKLYKTDKSETMVRAVLGVDSYRRGRNNRALKYFSGASSDKTMTLLMQLVKGWVEADEQDYTSARETFANIKGTAFFENFAELQLAKIDAVEGEYEAALERLDAVDASGVAGVESLLTRVRILDQMDRQDEAITELEEILVDNERLTIGPVGGYLKRLQAEQNLPEISFKGEASRSLTDPAFEFFARNRSIEGAELFLRFAIWLDPKNTKSSIWLASILEEQGDIGEDNAEVLYRSIGDTDANYVSAQLQLANIHFNRKEDDIAIKVLESLNAREQSVLTRESLGRARFFRENYEEALPFYEDLVGSLTDEEITANIEPLRFRAIIYERLKRWPEAEADFKRVLKLVPDDVDTLNYLGYTWVDRGENLTEAFDMIREAVKQQPQSGAIVDSLGWAHYKLGEYQEAKEKLEDAVALSPSSATIIDHLGDVYWKLGRKREAGFQWKRALEFDPTDEERATIASKLENGLDESSTSPIAAP